MSKQWQPQPLKNVPNQEMKTFEYNGLNLTYQQFFPSKDKTTILFLYGFGGNIEYLRDISPRLSNNDKYSVLTLDYPGHGYSNGDKPFIIDEFVDYTIALLDHLQIDKFILVGYSLGGAIAMKLLQKIKSRVEKLILMYSDLNFAYNLYKKCFFTSFKLMLNFGINFAINKLSIPLLVDKYICEQYIEESHQVVLFNDLSHVKSFYQQIIFKNYESLISQIECPTLIIGSKCDFLIPTKRYRRLQTLIPHSTLVINNDIGHLCIVTKPATIAHQVLTFLEQES